MRYAVLAATTVVALTMLAWMAVMLIPGNSFRIAGRVVDTEGSLLHGVTITVTEGMGVTMGWKKRPSRAPYVVRTDGQFELSTGSCVAATLLFAKPGYMDERVVVPNVEGVHRAPNQSGQFEVVMVPASPAPVKLVAFQTHSVAGQVDIQPDRPTGPHNRGWSEWFASHVQVETSRNGDGSAHLVQVSERLDELNSYRYWIPRELTVSMREGVSGGFVRFEPQFGRRLSRQMLEAPGDGYERTLVFDEQDMIRAKSFFLYVQVDGVYGRAMLSLPAVSYTQSSPLNLSASLIVELQPDGSRGLRQNVTQGLFERVGGEERRRQ